MKETPRLRVALVGHAFMGRAHAHAWATAPRFFALARQPEVAVAVGTSGERARRFADAFGIAEVSTDWASAVARRDIDVVDICVPGDLHAPVALAALAAGKHVLCEKPLANSVAEAEAMAAAAETAAEHGTQSMVGFNYRRAPAVALARVLIDRGEIGPVRHIRASYLQDWLVDPAFPLTWRLDRSRAGSGALGDLGCHIIDLAEFLTGHLIRSVSSLTKTFVTQRPGADDAHGLAGVADAPCGPVTVDDAFAAIGETDRGSLVTLEATRFAPGRKNSLRFEISGGSGSVGFDLERLNELEFLTRADEGAVAGFRRVLVTEPAHPYVQAWWPPGHGLGYEHTFTHQVRDFVTAIADGRAPEPSFADGLRVQRVLAAIADSAAAGGSRVEIG